VALADARRGINMFRVDGLNVPIVGIVENMAWFTPEELVSWEPTVNPWLYE
jgi:ATP-binding protein involved in chromosome partitioning